MDYIIHETRDQNDGEDAQEMDRRVHRLVLPEDGYEWKKYGQKFIKNIRKFRSYFKCQESSCMAKKRAEWCTSDPTNVRIVYDGVHSHTHHGSSPSSADQPRRGSSNTSSNGNQYNLLTQVFGDQSSNAPPASRRN
ncbi:WRKY transcription factor 23 [Citrus sinensis]|uniref:WRKY domain-containing protein n=3 Tax=Citrus TaxID=2706 RepID=A0A067EHB3_CITSI|nr:WRKY transcription factor 23 [Citrus sinensis]XP_024047358.1 probable WRKY transcription factor 23 [Citrus x clementina]KDO54478.1 hypothetical protein CISIN_1g032690mg [Citrus sinensis]